MIYRHTLVQRLGQIFMMIPKKAFAGLSVMAVADPLKLPTIRGKLILSLWHLFKCAELTEVVSKLLF